MIGNSFKIGNGQKLCPISTTVLQCRNRVEQNSLSFTTYYNYFTLVLPVLIKLLPKEKTTPANTTI